MEWEYQKMYIVLRNVNRNELSVPNPRCNAWFTITMACEPTVTRIRSWKKLQIIPPTPASSPTRHIVDRELVNRPRRKCGGGE